MPATLGSNLIDDLVPVVDDLRSSLSADMGTRQYEVHLIRRTWSSNGGRRGPPGTCVVTSDVTLSPPPLVEFLSADRLRWEMSPGGREQTGECRLTEVSLSYTEADLSGGVIGAAEDFYYELRDALGQSVVLRRYVPSAPPTTDRDKTIGWVVTLRKAEIADTVAPPPPPLMGMGP
jgi:hypothetical protein